MHYRILINFNPFSIFLVEILDQNVHSERAMNSLPVDAFSFHHPYLTQATREFTYRYTTHHLYLTQVTRELTYRYTPIYIYISKTSREFIYILYILLAIST